MRTTRWCYQQHTVSSCIFIYTGHWLALACSLVKKHEKRFYQRRAAQRSLCMWTPPLKYFELPAQPIPPHHSAACVNSFLCRVHIASHLNWTASSPVGFSSVQMKAIVFCCTVGLWYCATTLWWNKDYQMRWDKWDEKSDINAPLSIWTGCTVPHGRCYFELLESQPTSCAQSANLKSALSHVVPSKRV